jgi:hypothetical protein
MAQKRAKGTGGRRSKATPRTASRRKRVTKGTRPRTKAATPERRPLPGVTPAAAQERPGRVNRESAFFTDARHATDELAEELGESFVLSATSGEDPEEHFQRERPEEEGGPFLETSGRTEFAYGVDESNPEDAEKAPWPTVSPQR